MFILKCFKCKEVLGGVLNPSSIPYIRCTHCGFDNNANICVDKDSYYEDVREKGVLEHISDCESGLKSALFEQNVLFLSKLFGE